MINVEVKFANECKGESFDTFVCISSIHWDDVDFNDVAFTKGTAFHSNGDVQRICVVDDDSEMHLLDTINMGWAMDLVYFTLILRDVNDINKQEFFARFSQWQHDARGDWFSDDDDDDWTETPQIIYLPSENSVFQYGQVPVAAEHFGHHVPFVKKPRKLPSSFFNNKRPRLL